VFINVLILHSTEVGLKRKSDSVGTTIDTVDQEGLDPKDQQIVSILHRKWVLSKK
jgi:hypothetical protein